MPKPEQTDKDYFVFSITQKLGLPNYSSIDVFASLGREIDDDESQRDDVISKVEAIVEREIELIKENLGLK